MLGRLIHLSVFLLAAGLVIGCKTANPLQDKKNPDPLCVSKKPVEGRAFDVATATLEPR